MCSPFLSLSLGCECKHLLPSPRLPISIPIHALILPLRSTLSSGSSSLQNKLAIQAPTCFSKYSPSLHLDLQSDFISQPFFPLMSLLLLPGMFLLCSSLPSLPSLDCLPQSPLEGAVLPFGLFQSKFVKMSHITLSLGSFSPPFTSYLIALVQAVNCLCGCLVTSQSENGWRQVYLEDLCADPAICFRLEQSSSVSPHIQSIPVSCFSSDNGHCHQAPNLHVTCLGYVTGFSGHRYFNAYYCVRFPLPHCTSPPWHLFHYWHRLGVFPPLMGVISGSSCLCWKLLPRQSFP